MKTWYLFIPIVLAAFWPLGVILLAVAILRSLPDNVEIEARLSEARRERARRKAL